MKEKHIVSLFRAAKCKKNGSQAIEEKSLHCFAVLLLFLKNADEKSKVENILSKKLRCGYVV